MSEYFLEVHGTNAEYVMIFPGHLYYPSTRVFGKSAKWA